jgi:RNA-directed DNA polymerase
MFVGSSDYLKMVRGGDDPIYARLAIRTEKIAPTKPQGISIFGRSLNHDTILAEAVWIVIGLDSNALEVSQGTAFTLRAVGVISARHVFEEGKSNGAVRWVLINAANPLKRHPITGYRANQHVDLAVIESPAPTPASLLPGSKDIQVNDNVRIVGFPYWNTLGDQMFNAQTKVLQTKVVSAIVHILTGGPVRGGNSGGPFLSDEGYVTGVAVWDRTSLVAPDGGVAIKHTGIAAAAPCQPV